MPGDQRDPVRDMEMFAVFRQDGVALGRTDGRAACGLSLALNPHPYLRMLCCGRREEGSVAVGDPYQPSDRKYTHLNVLAAAVAASDTSFTHLHVMTSLKPDVSVSTRLAMQPSLRDGRASR